MIEAKIPETEALRLAALNAYDILDTEAEIAFDDLARIASSVCGTPIALVSLIDVDRQWFKSKVGLDASETPRSVAFCSHAILEPENVLVVEDAFEDKRFHDNPLATGAPNVRFYAGAPLVNAQGLSMGTLCVIDHVPREMSEEQLETLRALSRQVVSQLELRKSNASLKSLTGDLTRANDSLQQFTSIAAHDLQEPVRNLIAFSEILVEDLGDDLAPAAAEDLGYIVDASQRMRRLVSDLLEFSRTGENDLRREHVELNDPVSLALDAMSFRIAETKTRVIVDPLPNVQGDCSLLTQAFQNLISNAVKFCVGDHPEVHITCAVENGETVVGVRDNGIGMDPAYAEKIFDPFKRLHSRDEFEGTGIGLAIVRKVIERHGGSVWAESIPGSGSHFKFTLPGMQQPAQLSKSA